MRFVRALVAAVVLLSVGLSSVTPARAADSAWWLPSTWVTAGVGDLLSVIDALQGGSVDVVAGAGIDIGALYSGLPPNLHGRWHYVVELSGSTSAGGWPVLVWAARDGDARCAPGSDPNSPTSDCSAPQRPALGSVAQGFTVQVVCKSGVTGAAGWTDSSLTATARASCGSISGVESVLIPPRQFASYGYAYPEMRVWMAAPELQVVLTCRDTTTGRDTDISESSVTGVAPAPSCPAGSVPIRVRVFKGGELVQDTAIDQGALESWWSYIRDPMPWDWSGNAGDCRVTNVYDPSMVMVMPPDVCQDAVERGPLADGGDVEQDCADDIVCSVVQGGFATVKKLLGGIASSATKLVTGIKGVIDSVKNAAERIVDGIVDGVNSVVDRVVDAIEATQQAVEGGVDAIVDAIERLRNSMESGFEGIGDGGGGGGGDDSLRDIFICNADCRAGGDLRGLDWGELGDLGGWANLPGDLVGDLSPITQCGCSVIEVDLPSISLGGAQTVDAGSHVFLSTCSGWGSTMAAVSRAGTGFIVVLGTVLACVRFLASAVGFIEVASLRGAAHPEDREK